MSIKVKVLNANPEDTTELPEVSEEETSKILTSKYVREVNEGIAHRILQQRLSHSEEYIFN